MNYLKIVYEILKILLTKIFFCKKMQSAKNRLHFI